MEPLLCPPSQDLIDSWNDLYLQTPDATPFQSPAWVLGWMESTRRIGKLKLAVKHLGKDLIGVFPMVEQWKGIRPAATPVSDYLEPLGEEMTFCDWKSEKGTANGRSRFGSFPRHRSGSKLTFSHRPGWRAEEFEESVSFQIKLDLGFEKYASQLSKSLRQDVRRAQRNPHLSIVSYRGTQALEALPILVSLHKKRWQRQCLPGAFTRSRVKFHACAIRHGLDAEIKLLQWDGRPIGAIYLLHSRGSTCFYQCGMDHEFSSVSPGTVLIYDAIQSAFSQGKQTFDFLRGAEAYKFRWRPSHYSVLSTTLLIPPTCRGRLSAASYIRGKHIEMALRERFEGAQANKSPVSQVGWSSGTGLLDYGLIKN